MKSETIPPAKLAREKATEFRRTFIDQFEPQEPIIWPQEDPRPPCDEITVTEHRIRKHIDRVDLPDMSCEISGGTVMLSDGGQERGTMSFISYVAYDGPPKRPVAFICNGGPLSPSTLWNAWLVAPYTIEHERDGHLTNAWSARNPDTLLKYCDIVLYDPMGTGYGRALADQDPAHYHGVERDVQASTAFHRWFLKTEQLEHRPIIPIGSSYGAYRVTAVGGNLLEDGLNIAGLGLISPHYDYAMKRFSLDQIDDPRPFAAMLPAYAVIAQHHGLLGEAEQYLDSLELYHEVAQFAWEEYAPAIANSHRPSRRLAKDLAHYTGLPSWYTGWKAGRISPSVFQYDLLNMQCGPRNSQRLSALDGRLAFPNSLEPDIIDPALDRWEGEYKRFATQSLFRVIVGYKPENKHHNYVGIIQPKEWEFSGDWADHSARIAMRGLLAALPAHAPILEINGWYDLLGTHESRALFWDEILSESDRTRHYCGAELPDHIPEASILVSELSAGHQPGSHADSRARVSKMLCKLACRASETT